MLSIIIASYRQDYFNALKESISLSIGDIPFEIIQIWNPGIMSVSEAYNRGGDKAIYNYLLFLHEDVSFLSNDWGNILLNYLSLENTGICGLAGTVKHFRLPAGYETGLEKYSCVYVKHYKDEYLEPDLKLNKVKTLDGVFMAMPKHVWEVFRFDTSIAGYHCYDLDISLRVSGSYQNYVIPNIAIHHFSRGAFGDTWVKSILSFYKRSYYYDKTSRKELNEIKRFWYARLLREEINFKNRVRYVITMGVNRAIWRQAFKFLMRDKLNKYIRRIGTY